MVLGREELVVFIMAASTVVRLLYVISQHSNVSLRSSCLQGAPSSWTYFLSTEWWCKDAQIIPFRFTEMFSIFPQLNLSIQEVIFMLKNSNFIWEHSIESEATSFQAPCLKCCHNLSRSNFKEFLLRESKEFVKMLSNFKRL